MLRRGARRHHVGARRHPGEVAPLVVQERVGDVLLLLVILACSVLLPPVLCEGIERGTLLFERQLA
eukprot:6646165-Prymnesium_polylepis.1